MIDVKRDTRNLNANFKVEPLKPVVNEVCMSVGQGSVQVKVMSCAFFDGVAFGRLIFLFS